MLNIPSEWQHFLKDHFAFFTCQTIFVIVEVVFVSVRILLLRFSNWVVDLLNPTGIDKAITAVMLDYFVVVSLIPILLFVFVHASSIVKWTVDRSDVKWLFRVFEILKLSRHSAVPKLTSSIDD